MSQVAQKSAAPPVRSITAIHVHCPPARLCKYQSLVALGPHRLWPPLPPSAAVAQTTRSLADTNERPAGQPGCAEGPMQTSQHEDGVDGWHIAPAGALLPCSR